MSLFLSKIFFLGKPKYLYIIKNKIELKNSLGIPKNMEVKNDNRNRKPKRKTRRRKKI